MGNVDLSTFFSSQPELYAIFALMAYLGRKYWPVLKEKIEVQKAQHDGDMRREKHLEDISQKLTMLLSKMDSFATKDDVIDLALHRPSKKGAIINGSGSIAKQGV